MHARKLVYDCTGGPFLWQQICCPWLNSPVHQIAARPRTSFGCGARLLDSAGTGHLIALLSGVTEFRSPFPLSGTISLLLRLTLTLNKTAHRLGTSLPVRLIAPVRAQQRGSRGKRRHNERSELCLNGRSEGSGTCADAGHGVGLGLTALLKRELFT